MIRTIEKKFLTNLHMLKAVFVDVTVNIEVRTRAGAHYLGTVYMDRMPEGTPALEAAVRLHVAAWELDRIPMSVRYTMPDHICQLLDKRKRTFRAAGNFILDHCRV